MCVYVCMYNLKPMLRETGYLRYGVGHIRKSSILQFPLWDDETYQDTSNYTIVLPCQHLVSTTETGSGESCPCRVAYPE